MQPIFNRQGQVVAWYKGTNIYHINGAHAAVINGENIYDQRGRHLGIFKKGIFRDHKGGAVAFISGASGGPILPITSISPIPPMMGDVIKITS
jgi:hypothetical protein